MALPEADWLGFCRRAAEGARAALARHPTTGERSVEAGPGEGGDTALVIDRAAEDAVLAELERLDVPVVAVSEERGEVELAGGGPARVVIDPIDGSLNAKRALPFASLSIAVASGPRMDEVELAFVAELEAPREWWALRRGGAFRGRERLEALRPGSLELLGLEGTRPEMVAAAAAGLGSIRARRIRALGSVAATLCLVGDGRLDAMVGLRPVRSVDVAAAQLVVREAGGAIAFPDAGARPALDLEMRTRVAAARSRELLDELLAALPEGGPG